jgi:multiple sugar transport system permease protein
MTAVANLPQRSAPRLSFRPARILLYILVVGGALIYAMPFIWMLSTSVKPQAEIFLIPPRWLPSVWQWRNYTLPWENLPMLTFYKNTIIVTGLNIIGTLASSSIVAFAFARMRFRGRGVLFIIILATMMLPRQVTLIPLYLIWSKLGMLNTFGPLVIPSFFGHAFSIFLLRQYMMAIPLEMDEAARIDGASWFQLYWRIILPLSTPALGVVAIYAFTTHWNDFLEPLIYLNRPNMFTLPLGLGLLNGRYGGEMQQIMAQTALSIIPVLLVFFLTQRSYMQGVVVSGVKG